MIEVKELRRSFGPVIAVDGISFNVQKGEVLGLLGPNGAGKTTAMRMLACFIKPDSGTATVCGHDILKNPLGVRRSIGYLAENSPAYNEMTVGGFLNFVCDVRQIKGAKRRETLDRVVPVCSIESVYHQTIETLSKGYKRRVGLAQALIHDPEVLILDEPTDGLDPNQKHEVRRLISKMGKDKCIIISTHILEEVEAICSRTIIIARGRILADSTPTELKEQYHGSLDKAFRKITKTRVEAEPAIVLSRKYLNNEYNFTLSYPEDWEVIFENQVESFPYTQPVRLAGSKMGASKPTITVVTAIVEDDGTCLATYMQKAESDLRAHFSEFKLLSKKETSLLGWPTAWMTYNYQGDNGTIQELNVTTFIGRGRIFWFQFICESDKNEASRQFRVFEAIISSLSVGKAGLRHPNVSLAGASHCGICGHVFGSDDAISAMVDLTTGRLQGVCEHCRRGATP